MRFLFSCLLASSLLLTEGWGIAPPFSCGWEFYAGTAGLFRSRPHHQPLVIDANTLNTVVDANQFDFGISPGYDLRAKKWLGRFFIDGRFLKVKEWHDSFGNVALPAEAFLPTNTPPLPFFEVIPGNDFTYASKLWTGEVNAGTCLPCFTRFNLFCGYRRASIKEHLTIFSNTNVPAINSTVAVEIKTDNSLWGPQVGAALTCLPLCWGVSLEGFLKWWIYTDSAKGNFGTFVNNTLDESFSGSTRSKSYGVDGMLGLSTSLFKRFTLHLNYEALFLNRVALASDQLPGINYRTDSFVPERKSILYHGILAGISLKW